MRGYGNDGCVEHVRAAGGEVYAITSEPQSLARQAQEDWQTDLIHVGDPHHEILATVRDRGWLSLYIADWGQELVTTEWTSHPKGYFQPGVLAVGRSKRVLYRWRSTPTRSNIGGAIGRPTPSHVWSKLSEALEEPAGAPDADPDDHAQLDAKPASWPLFVLVLFANGWFLKPQTFQYTPGAAPIAERQRRALRRIPLFLAAWLVLAVLAPWWVTAGSVTAYLALVTPGVLQVHRRFQNVREGEKPEAY